MTGQQLVEGLFPGRRFFRDQPVRSRKIRNPSKAPHADLRLDEVLPELLVLLRLAVQAVVCLLQQTSKQSFQLFRPADKRNKRQASERRRRRDRVSEAFPSHLSRQLLGSESSPRHMVLLPRQSGLPPLSAPSAGLSPLWEDGSLYALCSVTSRLPANGE